MQSLTVGIIGSAMSARQSQWNVRNTPSFNVEMPRDAALTITLIEGTIGDVEIEGDLQIDKVKSNPNLRTLRWSSNARETEQGEATIKVTNAQGKLNDVTLSVAMSEDEAAVTVQVSKPKQKPYLGIELVDRYGAYALAGLCALGALLFALVLPSSHDYLVGGAGSIALAGFFFTEEYDSYLARALAFAAAFVLMVFACLAPGFRVWAMGAAASACTVGLIWGDEELDEVKDLLPFWPF